ncbi:hypothetical protein GQ473_01215 [archaeon]|nr:hypothetical protein [archaeon]
MNHSTEEIYLATVKHLLLNGYVLGDGSGKRFASYVTEIFENPVPTISILKIPENPKNFLGLIPDKRLDSIGDIYFDERGMVFYCIHGENDSIIVDAVDILMNTILYSSKSDNLVMVTKLEGREKISKENTWVSRLGYTPCSRLS